MNEEELKALEEGTDTQETTPTPTTTPEQVTTESTTAPVSPEQTTTPVEGTTEEAPAEETKEDKRYPKSEQARKQGEKLGMVLLILVIIGIGSAIYYALTHTRALGIKPKGPTIIQSNKEETKEEIEEPKEEKQLAEPEADTADLKEDVKAENVDVNKYIANEEYGSKWFKCSDCKQLIKAKDIYITQDNTIYFIDEKSNLYTLNTTRAEVHTPELMDGNNRYNKILNSNLFRGEDGVYYSYEEPVINEDEPLKKPVKYDYKNLIKTRTSSKIPTLLSSNVQLNGIHSFRPNQYDTEFNIGLGERYYVVEGEDIYLIDKDGKKTDKIFSLGNDENFVSITGNVIKTTKMFYSIRSESNAGNFDYKFYPDNINKYYNQIKYYNDIIIIDKKNNVYIYGVE